MKIVQDLSAGYSDVVEHYYNLQRFSHLGYDDTVIFLGYAAAKSDRLKEENKHFARKIYIQQEAPCSLFDSNVNSENCHGYFDIVYSMCPYLGDYFQKEYGHTTQYFYMPPPMYDKIADFGARTSITDKIYDSFYMGHLHSSIYFDFINVIRKRPYVFCSFADYEWVTHRNIPSPQKHLLCSQSKTSIRNHLLYLNETHIDWCTGNYKNWYNNEALKMLTTKHVAPHFRGCHENGLCKTLNLVYKDDWNVIEKTLTPGEDFLYWSSIEELTHLLNEVCGNYHRYWSLIESCYEKSKKYTIESMFPKILEGDPVC
jgi:NAD-dependent dihydropyrimidine dehydrogenase PreA subunit